MGIAKYRATVTAKTLNGFRDAASTWMVSSNTTCHLFRFLSIPFLPFLLYSWNRADPAPLDQFLTIITSHDMFLRKQAPFRGCTDTAPHLGPKSPFVSVYKHFQTNLAKY